jgi:aminoglycoside 6'-N-acetyltransferase I
MTVREATAADLPTLLALSVAFFAEDGFTTAEADLKTNLAVLTSSGHARVAVYDDGQVQAFAITTTCFGLENGLLAELQDLYVTPSARRRGLAGVLIEDSAAWARRLGSPYLELVIAPNGLDVSHLDRYYAGHGFRDDGRHLIRRPLTT